MKIKTRYNIQSFEMKDVRKWEVKDVERRFRLHWGWGILMALFFWPALIVYLFVGTTNFYTIEVEFQDGSTITTRVSELEMIKMKTQRFTFIDDLEV